MYSDTRVGLNLFLDFRLGEIRSAQCLRTVRGYDLRTDISIRVRFATIARVSFLPPDV